VPARYREPARAGEAGGPVPGALDIGDGGGKEGSRLLGCGLEKRLPYPRETMPSLSGRSPWLRLIILALKSGAYLRSRLLRRTEPSGMFW